MTTKKSRQLSLKEKRDEFSNTQGSDIETNNPVLTLSMVSSSPEGFLSTVHRITKDFYHTVVYMIKQTVVYFTNAYIYTWTVVYDSVLGQSVCFPSPKKNIQNIVASFKNW